MPELVCPTINALNGILPGSILIRYRFQLPVHVTLSVRDNEGVAIKRPFTCASIDFQLDSVCGVDKVGAAAMHFLTGHRAQIDQKPKLIFSVELLQSHMLWFVFFFHKEATDLCSSIPAFDAVVAQHIRRAVYRH